MVHVYTHGTGDTRLYLCMCVCPLICFLFFFPNMGTKLMAARLPSSINVVKI